MNSYEIYPNFYVVLLAGSGRMRKSTVIRWLARVYQRMESPPHIVPSKITPEAFIEFGQEASDVPEALGGQRSSDLIVLADEMIVFLNKRSYEQGLGDILLKVFDCDSVEYQTRGRGLETMHDTCCNILGGATMRGVAEEMPPGMIGSGLASRIIFVHCKDPKPPVSMSRKDPERDLKMDWMARTLTRLRSLRGEVRWGEGAFEVYDRVYNQHYHGSKHYDDQNLSGYASRWHKHLLSIAICLAVSQMERLEILPHHVEGAITLLEATEEVYPDVMASIKGTQTGQTLEEIIAVIRSAKRIRREDLIKKTKHILTAQELSTLLQTAVEAGQVEAKPSDGGMWYIYIPEAAKPVRKPPTTFKFGDPHD